MFGLYSEVQETAVEFGQMGSSASTRARAKAAAAAAASSSASASGFSDVICGTAHPVNAAANAGGDVGGITDQSSPGLEAAAPQTSVAKGNLDGDLQDVEDEKSTEDSSSASEDSEPGKPTVSDDAGNKGKDGLLPEKSPSKVDQATATAISAAPCLCDVACQADCIGDVPDDPVVTSWDSLQQLVDRNLELSDRQKLPSAGSEEVRRPCGDVRSGKDESLRHQPRQQEDLGWCCGGVCKVGDQHKAAAVAGWRHQINTVADVHSVASPDKARLITVGSFPAGDDHPYPVAGAFPSGSGGLPPVKVHGSTAPPDWQQLQQRHPAASECPFPGGMEGDRKATAAANPDQPSPPVGDVAVLEGRRTRVISVAYDGKVGDSNSNLPPVAD